MATSVTFVYLILFCISTKPTVFVFFGSVRNITVGT